MPPPPPQNRNAPQTPAKSGLSGGATIGIMIASGIGLLGISYWLFLAGGTATVMGWLPPGVSRAFIEKTGDVKVIEKKADPDSPWDKNTNADRPPTARGHGQGDDDDGDKQADGTAKNGEGADKGEGDKGEPSKKVDAKQVAAPKKIDEAEAAADTVSPIKAAVAAADKAIAAYADSADDQVLYMAANKAVEGIKAAPVKGETAALRQAATELRAEMTVTKHKELEEARKLARATDKIQGATKNPDEPYIVLRSAANNGSDDVAHLEDDILVHHFLDTGNGWSRIEVINGDAAGKNGYIRAKNLASLGKKAKK